MDNISDANKRPIENDMISRQYNDDDKFSSKVFKLYPLVGDYELSETAYSKCFGVAKKAIDTYIKYTDNIVEPPKYALWVHEQIALVVVHMAKQWNSNEEGKFTRYVAMQFGYRDDSGRVWGIITRSLDIAFNKNKKFFIRRNGDREFYETVMAHSFGPVRSWFPLFDLLFNFYTDNLDWNYVPDDPLFHRLVEVLRKKFNNDTLADEEYLIASASFRFRIGLRRIVQERPVFCAKLFEDIIRRIHLLVSNKATSGKRYVYTLVDQWFAEKLSSSKAITAKAVSKSTKDNVEVALDYKSITPKYGLSGDNLYIQIPSIRIINDYSGNAFANIFVNDKNVDAIPLQIKGNELGETVQSKKIELRRSYFADDNLNITLKISLGDDVIFDSERKLWRQVIAFSDGREVNLNKMRKEQYLLFAVNPSKLDGDNIDIQHYSDTGISRVSLHKDFCLRYNNNTLAIDIAEINDIRIVSPIAEQNAFFEFNGREYSIVSNDSFVTVYIGNEKDLLKYHVDINGSVAALADFFDKSAGNRAMIPINGKNGSVCEASIVNLAADQVVFRNAYYVVNSFSCVFNKKYYLPSDDSESKSVLVKVNGLEMRSGINPEQTRVDFEYDSGLISVNVPCFTFTAENVGDILFGRYLDASAISSASLLRFYNSTGRSFDVSIGSLKYTDPKLVPLQVSSDEIGTDEEYADIVIGIGEDSFVAYTMVLTDMFVSKPALIFKDDTLFWDGGISYIGDKSHNLSLYLENNGDIRYSFRLSFGESEVYGFNEDEFEDNYYTWYIKDENTQKILACDNSFIGSECKVRFADKIISIDSVTEDIEADSSNIDIKQVFIDQIKYVDTMYVDSEDEVFDVYKGRMYWVDYYGDKRFFSFNYIDEKSKYKVNPVKIIYINDRYLRIVNQDDEGIYCYYNNTSREPGYEITDREPPIGAKNYKDILFYLFTTIQIESNKKPSTSIREKDTVEVHDKVVPIISEPSNNEQSADNATTVEVNDNTVSVVNEYSSLTNMKKTTQEEIIKAPATSRILVNAGPGTGKTWTLIEKLIYMVHILGVDPESIQVLCFSRAAVEVIRTRMRNAIIEGRADVNINYVDIRTFDSFATQFLYWVKDSDYTSISKSYNIESLNYEERIGLFIDVLKKNPELISQCEHLIVDEVQDLVLNRASMVLEMIKALPQESGVTLFGDACQAIYDYQVEDGTMNSEKFYGSIEDMNSFTFCSFDKNYRQASHLQAFSEYYRQAILKADVDTCVKCLNGISKYVPEYDVLSVKSFDENTLDRLLAQGNIGILTRSNAQALRISSIFRQKNISHCVKRRIDNHYFNAWIAYLFNTTVKESFDRDSFVIAMDEFMKDNGFSVDDVSEIWNVISESGRGTTGRVSNRDLLIGIKHLARNKGLYIIEKDSPVMISTIHRSKGREYDSVILLDKLLSDNSSEMEEQRVNYVALTRAKERIFKVSLGNVYFNTLKDRRCYTIGYKGSRKYLKNLEIGKEYDFDGNSFAALPGVQEYIRSQKNGLLNSEVYLEKDTNQTEGIVIYNLVLRSNGLVLARTTNDFFEDLSDALRKVYNLPWFKSVYESLYPRRFTGLYITEIASDIGMAKGNEKGVVSYGEMTAWNTLLIDGYAKAEYWEAH